MADCTVLSVHAPNPLTPPETDLSCLPAKFSRKLWVNPTEFLVVTHALRMAEWAVQLSQRVQRRLPAPARRGPRSVYSDSSILVMALLHVAWQMTYAEVVDYFRAHAAAAQAAGFPAGRVISVGQYWERRRALGMLPFWFLFVGMVWQVTRMGIIQGTDMILDATTQKAWFHEDSEAGWSFPKPWKGSVWGYKVHTLLCRWSALPVMFLVTPANAQESRLAIPLLVLAVAFFAYPIVIVRADAGYFISAILNFTRVALHAGFVHVSASAAVGFVIDYDLRRRGQHFLATLFFLWQWRFHQKPRATIERHFAWAKRCFGLEAGRWAGLVAAYQHTALVYATLLGVALVAHRDQRPDLAGSPTCVLAARVIG